jgi:hypothetical protein
MYAHFSQDISVNTFAGRAMPEADSRRPLTSKAWVPVRVMVTVVENVALKLIFPEFRFSQPISFHFGSPNTYTIRMTNTTAVGRRSSETFVSSHRHEQYNRFPDHNCVCVFLIPATYLEANVIET